MNTLNSWCSPSEANRLDNDEVHVWRVNLDCTPSYVQRMLKFLSEDEKVRAWKFSFDEARNHYIVARGSLRVVLSKYLKKDPVDLHFSYNPYGKPRFSGLSKVDDIKFNVSHSYGVALFAFVRKREVGIDLERIFPDIEYEQIAKRFFSPNEYAILREIPNGKLRERAFYNCWTRKESYIKARGEGLSISLDQFEVSLIPGEPAKLLKYNDIPQEVNRWSFKEIQPARGFVASLTVEGWDWDLVCFDAF